MTILELGDGKRELSVVNTLVEGEKMPSKSDKDKELSLTEEPT